MPVKQLYFLFYKLCVCVCLCAKSLLSCSTLCDHVNYSLSGFSVHGVLQTRILNGLPWPSPTDLPHPGIKPVSLALQGRFSLPSAPPGKPIVVSILQVIELRLLFVFNFTHWWWNRESMTYISFCLCVSSDEICWVVPVADDDL